MAEARASPVAPGVAPPPLSNELSGKVDDLLEANWDNPVKDLGTPAGEWDVPLKAAELQEKLQQSLTKSKSGSRLPKLRNRSPGLWRRPSRPPLRTATSRPAH